MKAYRVIEQGRAEFQEMPVPQPAAGEVLVRVAGCGLCHSDVGFIHKYAPETMPGGPPPFTLGHEAAGHIAAVGDGINAQRIGEAVCIYSLWGSCGRCRACRTGDENLCTAALGPVGCGVGRDGGLAQFVLVPSERFLVSLGSVDPRIGGILACAGATTFAAVEQIHPLLLAGATVLVIGAGGLGALAIQIVRAVAPSRVIALDTNPARLDIARACGADCTLTAEEGCASTVRALTLGEGVDAVIDCVGTDDTMRLAAGVLRRGGQLVLVGAGRGSIPFALHQIPFGARFSTVMNGGTRHLRSLISLLELGRISLMADLYPLERAPQAYEAMNSGSLRGRAVCVPDMADSP